MDARIAALYQRVAAEAPALLAQCEKQIAEGPMYEGMSLVAPDLANQKAARRWLVKVAGVTGAKGCVGGQHNGEGLPFRTYSGAVSDLARFLNRDDQAETIEQIVGEQFARYEALTS